MPCQVLTAPLSEAEIGARKFYDRWIGESGLFSFIGRLIFRLSGPPPSSFPPPLTAMSNFDQMCEPYRTDTPSPSGV
jgi:hypothetical protein